MEAVGYFGLFFIIYGLVILTACIVGRIDFHSRSFSTKEEKIYWRKKLFGFSLFNGVHYLRYAFLVIRRGNQRF